MNNFNINLNDFVKELYEKAQLNQKDMSISAGFAKFLFYVKTQYSPGNYRHI